MTASAIIALALAAAAPGATPSTDPFVLWNSGDFAHAVEAARHDAAAGDADAEFLLGEAYRLGRGVAPDPKAALGWYRQAAAQGHSRASDSLGLLLFAQGQRAEAMPLLVQSAERGEPRALYLVGTAHFNGDFVTKDWPLAYAMMTRAAEAGIAQARASLATMDRYLTATDKAKAQALLAAPRLGGAAPARSAAATPRPARPAPVAAPAPAPVQRPAPVTPKNPPASAARGAWRVQLGAFGSADRAEAAWTALVGKIPDLQGLGHQVVSAGAVRRLQATGLASNAAANALCRKVTAAGGGCIAIAP